MHMIQANELAQYEEDKTITKLKPSFQTYSNQTWTAHATLSHVLAVYKLHALHTTLSDNKL